MDNYKPKKGRGVIYKYTSPSGKSYIGQTTQSLGSRAGHHGKNYLGCKYFWSAIQKYGWQNFTVEVLGEFPTEQLNFQERKFIELYHTLAPNGYNIQFGVDTNYHKGRKDIYQYDCSTGKLIKRWDGQKQVADAFNISVSTINQCLNGRTSTAAGYCWSFQLLEQYPISQLLSNKAEPVYMYDLENKLLNKFGSIGEAASFIKGERSMIRKACRGELNTAYGYRWKSLNKLEEGSVNNKPKQILQLDKDTNKIIQIFPSISAAARKLNLSGTSGIRRALKNKESTAYGYKWKESQGSTTNGS